MIKSDATLLKTACQNRSLSWSFDADTGVLTIGQNTFIEFIDAEDYLETVTRTDGL